MACFLRFSSFLSMTLRVSWKKSVNVRLKDVPINLSYRNLPSTNIIPLASFSSVESNVMTLERLEKSLDQLDIDAKYKHNIDIRDMEEILKALEHWGTINYYQSLILLKCCGIFSLEIEPHKRIELLEKAISLIEKSGVELTISHYNSLLAAYIENEQEFSPTDILDILQKKNIYPNKITYQKLLKAYCQKGDIAGASEILEKMKNLDFSLNEDIFNSLILGHCQLNDKANARAILSLMESKGIEPTSQTYLSFLCGHAKLGEIDEIRQIFEECEKKEIIFFDKDILQVVYVLATNNHLDYIDEVLRRRRGHFGYKAEVRYYALKLLHKNLDSVALKIFETTTTSNSKLEDESRRYGNYFISFFTRYRSMRETINFCKYVEAKDLISTPYSTALKMVLQLEDPEKAFEMFDAMKEHGIPLRPHYFWPLLILASKEGNESMLKIIKKMGQMSVSPCSYTFSRIFNPNYKFQSDCIRDMEALVEAGVQKSSVVRSLFKCFLEHNRLEDAIKIASSCAFPFNSNNILSIIVNSTTNKFVNERTNGQFFVNMVYVLLHDLRKSSGTGVQGKRHAADSSSDSEAENDDDLQSKCEEFVGNMVLKLMKTCDESLMSVVLQEMLSKKIGVSSVALKMVEEKFTSAEVKELISQLSDKRLCMEWDEGILKKKKEYMSQEGYSRGSIAKQIGKMIDLAHKNEQDEAVALCKDLLETTDITWSLSDKKKFKAFMMHLAKSGKIEAVEEVFSCGIKHNIISEKNFYPLVYTMMVRGDLEGATDMFCQRVVKTKCQSSCHGLVRRLIEEQNVALLQKVTDVITQVQGEAFCMGVLISQFSDMGKLKEMRKLLDSRGYVSPKASLNVAYNWLYMKKSVGGLEALLSVTKNIHSANRMMLCHLLLKLYILEEDAQKALDLWWLMDEEDIPSRPQLVSELANLLQEKNIPVPFKLDSHLVGGAGNDKKGRNSVKPD